MNPSGPTKKAPLAAESTESTESAPAPSYAPAGMAMGIIMLMWGILTHWLMSAVGASVMIWSLYAWIYQLSEVRENE
ncbi:MAG: hypothetical protein P8N76_16060 [Pirellulaceae bacterium]|nr:hypothetical protein [Pirellulaceae bacterium]